MDLFDFDHDDHPKLRERTLSVDSVQGADSLCLDSDGNPLVGTHAGFKSNLTLGLGLAHGNSTLACPILSPRPVAPAFAAAAGITTTTTTTTTAGGITSSQTSSSRGLYETNSNSSNKHLPAFFYQVDREQSMTPESTFRTSRSHESHPVVAAAPTTVSAPGSDSESEKPRDVEYEVKIDHDFDAHASQTAESRGHSPRPGQAASLTAGPEGSTINSSSGVKSANVSPPAGPRRPRHKMTPDDFKFLKVIGRGA